MYKIDTSGWSDLVSEYVYTEMLEKIAQIN